ncbi:MAG: pur operon repressor [Firmicutes bacterium]|uniref:Purine operon repressor, PurR n=1 Tax=Melghirimyces thermohalophilus TaxID=1236220 RepID=A0A1G6Q0I1_9BACL|nr:pur operon repressor [Melghirimyces thermohalophilus]MDA8354204.1 pur operon repressor [Bacillota bacterium]SDC85972.1 purine operon repressor, PurR [Melghirimyces thermohalophilus]
MKKWKRSSRLVHMTQELMQNPHRLLTLSSFAERYQAAKSSISEDLAIIQEVCQEEGLGELETVSGAAGGARFLPGVDPATARDQIDQLCGRLADPARILPGGYLYLSDLLGDSALVRDLGRIFASVFARSGADAVVTVETKGIPLAYAAAAHLGVPVAIVRKHNRITEGSVVTINTVSGSSKRLGSLSLSRRSLQEGARVLIIDDFMKAGGTIRGMIHLLHEFHADVVGVGVMTDSLVEERLVEDYISLTTVAEVDVKEKKIRVVPGNFNMEQQGGILHGKDSDR